MNTYFITEQTTWIAAGQTVASATDSALGFPGIHMGRCYLLSPLDRKANIQSANIKEEHLMENILGKASLLESIPPEHLTRASHQSISMENLTGVGSPRKAEKLEMFALTFT